MAPGAVPTLHTLCGIPPDFVPSMARTVRLGADPSWAEGCMGVGRCPWPQSPAPMQGLLVPIWFHSPSHCGNWAGEGPGAGEGPSVLSSLQLGASLATQPPSELHSAALPRTQEDNGSQQRANSSPGESFIMHEPPVVGGDTAIESGGGTESRPFLGASLTGAEGLIWGP